MQLELSKSQFLALMRLVFLGETVVNEYHDTQWVDRAAADLRDHLVREAVRERVTDYVTYSTEITGYDYAPERSAEFYEILDQYRDQGFYDDLVEIISKNVIRDSLGASHVESMSDEAYDAAFTRTVAVVEKEFRANGYDNVTLKAIAWNQD